MRPIPVAQLASKHPPTRCSRRNISAGPQARSGLSIIPFQRKRNRRTRRRRMPAAADRPPSGCSGPLPETARRTSPCRPRLYPTDAADSAASVLQPRGTWGASPAGPAATSAAVARSGDAHAATSMRRPGHPAAPRTGSRGKPQCTGGMRPSRQAHSPPPIAAASPPLQSGASAGRHSSIFPLHGPSTRSAPPGCRRASGRSLSCSKSWYSASMAPSVIAHAHAGTGPSVKVRAARRLRLRRTAGKGPCTVPGADCPSRTAFPPAASRFCGVSSCCKGHVHQLHGLHARRPRLALRPAPGASQVGRRPGKGDDPSFGVCAISVIHPPTPPPGTSVQSGPYPGHRPVPAYVCMYAPGPPGHALRPGGTGQQLFELRRCKGIVASGKSGSPAPRQLVVVAQLRPAPCVPGK